MPKPQRQPSLTTTKATSGTPMTLENLAAASKIAVASARSLRGNQYPVALEPTGKAGASATPSMARATNTPPKPLATAVIAEARPHRKAPQRPMRVTP